MDLDFNLDEPAAKPPTGKPGTSAATALQRLASAPELLSPLPTEKPEPTRRPVKSFRLPLIGGKSVSSQLQLLAAAFLALLILAACLAIMDGRTAARRAMHLGMAGEVSALTERIARLSPQAAQGAAAAQLELQIMRKRSALLLALLDQGGEFDGRAVSAVDTALRPAFDNLRKRWTPFDRAAQQLATGGASGEHLQSFNAAYGQAREAVTRMHQDATDAIDQRLQNRALISALGSLAMLALVLAFRVYNEDVLTRQARLARQRREAEEANGKTQAAIRQLMDEMTNLADGDLTVRASVNENLMASTADAMNFAIEELSVLVKRINATAQQIANATDLAARTSEKLLAASDTQSQEIRRASEQVLSMAQSMNEASGKAEQSASVARQSLEAATHGAAEVAKSVSGMEDIRGQIQETSKRIKRLGESSQEIGEIVELITDITDQTNVLALNAAIQAATAGEAGRGFSAVAEEVQQLAVRSADATQRIAALVKTIQTDTHDAVMAMEHSTLGVVEGTRLSDGAGQALANISVISRQLAELIEGITADTRQQARVAAHVAQAMALILRITEQTSSGTRSTAISTSNLADLAVELKASVSGFKV